MASLESKVFIVTGAAGGIGSAIAAFLSAQGAKLVLCDVGCDEKGQGADDGRLQSVAQGLSGPVVTSALDITSAGAADTLVGLAAQLGGVDGFVHCAGIQYERTWLNFEPEALARVFDVQVRAPMALGQAVARALVDQEKSGGIVFVTGTHAFFGVARHGAMAATSGALTGLVRSAALELRKHGVRVNALAATARTRANEGSPTFSGIKAGSMSPEFVAPVAGFLLSDSCEVSGEVVGVAGGRVYGLRTRESTGGFSDAPFDVATLAAEWSAFTRR